MSSISMLNGPKKKKETMGKPYNIPNTFEDNCKQLSIQLKNPKPYFPLDPTKTHARETWRGSGF